jgi:structure-specific recognition protein 1
VYTLGLNQSEDEDFVGGDDSDVAEEFDENASGSDSSESEDDGPSKKGADGDDDD